MKGKWILSGILAAMLLLSSALGPSLAQSPVMDYHDVSEARTLLRRLDADPHARLFIIGYSYDYRNSPNSPVSYPIYAIRISANTPDSVEDNHRKNAILFECGMHPREWLTSESCLMLAQYLVDHIHDAKTGVPELLREVDVWIIPMSNPAGRAIDDVRGGDPRHYSTSPLSAGWRGNGDTRLCSYGVNVARNFSRGFNDAGAHVYCSGNYRGFAPFSTSEANALREFVENHGISMAVILHAPGQQIWNQWGGGDIAGSFMIEEAARIWRAGWSDPADRARYDLAREGVGGGNGQFSAWLSRESTRSDGETDASGGPWGVSGDLPIAGDFDRDGEVDDVAVFRPSERKWFYDYDHDGDTDESRGPWGWSGDLPIAGDFDRDGEVDDVAVFRPSERKWFYDYDHDGDTDETRGTWGWDGDLPIAGDFDRDGEVDDVAVFRPSERKWFYDYDHDGDTDYSVGTWGWRGDLPIAGDFDRDGRVDDVAVFRPSKRIWFYDVDHDGTTDHVSGPWGWSGDLPVAGDFNGDGRMDDVGILHPPTRMWYYDDRHNATVRQPDEGTLRAVQTIMVELPFADHSECGQFGDPIGVCNGSLDYNNYYGGPYQAANGDGSNTFHPSGTAIRDLIQDSFIPMAKYLIRQSRSPGCPTRSDGSPELTKCPHRDFGIVAAKIARSGDEAGQLKSYPAQRTSWEKISPAYEELPAGHVLFYRAQNFSRRVASFDVQVRVEWVECQGTDCWEMVDTRHRRFANVPIQGVVSDAIILNLKEDTDYTITIEVRPSGGFESGARDDFAPNDKKILKFRSKTRSIQHVLSLPLLLQND